MEESNLCLPRQNKTEVVDSCGIKRLLSCGNCCTIRISQARQSDCGWLDQHTCCWEMGAEGLHLRRREGACWEEPLRSAVVHSLITELCTVLYFSSGSGCCCSCACWCGQQSYECMLGRHVRSEVLRETGKCPCAYSGMGEWKYMDI